MENLKNGFLGCLFFVALFVLIPLFIAFIPTHFKSSERFRILNIYQDSEYAYYFINYENSKSTLANSGRVDLEQFYFDLEDGQESYITVYPMCYYVVHVPKSIKNDILHGTTINFVEK